jgi:hypothetical protein
MQTILQFIGLFLLLILSFFGGNYLLRGDTIISGTVSLVLVISIYFLIEFLKKRKVQITKSSYSASSILLWGVFVLLAAPIAVLILHALNVEMNAKRDLQAYAKAIVAKNQDALNLFQSENQQYIEETHLIATNALDVYVNTSNKSMKDSIKNVLEGSPFRFSDFSAINKSNYTTRATQLRDALEMRSEAVFDSVQVRTNSVLNSSVYLVDNWSRMRVVVAIAELEAMLEKNINQLNRFLVDENFKRDVFVANNELKTEVLSIQAGENNELTITKSTIQLSSLRGLWVAYKPYWLLLPVLIFLFLLLIPYFLEKTAGVYIHSDSKGSKVSDEGGIEI